MLFDLGDATSVPFDNITRGGTETIYGDVTCGDFETLRRRISCSTTWTRVVGDAELKLERQRRNAAASRARQVELCAEHGLRRPRARCHAVRAIRTPTTRRTATAVRNWRRID